MQAACTGRMGHKFCIPKWRFLCDVPGWVMMPDGDRHVKQ